MNIALAAGGIVLMGIGGYTLGAQLIVTMNASVNTSPEVAMFTFGGLLVDGVGFASFMRGFNNHPLSLVD